MEEKILMIIEELILLKECKINQHTKIFIDLTIERLNEILESEER